MKTAPADAPFARTSGALFRRCGDGRRRQIGPSLRSGKSAASFSKIQNREYRSVRGREFRGCVACPRNSALIYNLSMRKTFPLFVTGLLLFAAAARTQTVDDFKSPRSQCCLPGAAQRLADQLGDWNMLGQFYAANEELKKQAADPKRVVFMGDSITLGWHLDQSFPNKPYVNRGISGQTTPQMLVRMF